MASYVKITDYAAKDALLKGNPSKLVKGTELGAEFDLIASADADSLKSASIGVSVQAYDAFLTSVAALGTAADKMIYTTALNTASETAITSFARSILDDADEATFKATVNLEPGVDVQAYDADTAKLGVDQSWTGAQRGTVTTDNDGSFDMAVTNNFICTPTAGFTLTFTNITAGQSGNIYLVNGSNYAIAAAATTKVTGTLLSAISSTGEYWLSYFSPDGTNVLVAHAGDFS